MKKNINFYRKEIDQIDKKILDLIIKRAYCAIEIGKIKSAKQDTIYNPKREKGVINALIHHNEQAGNSPLDHRTIESVFTEIISSCRALEHKPRVAYLGPDGSFSQLATFKQFGSSIEMFPQKNINAIFEQINRDQCDYGVLPIENSIEGMVNNAIDLLSTYDVYINAELYLPIHLCLFVNSGFTCRSTNTRVSSDNGNVKKNKLKIFSKVKVLYSHPQPFGQARNWIEKNLPFTKLQETHSTSHAAEECLKTSNSACIGSKHLLKVFPQLQLMEETIEDGVKNTTRFIVISKENTIPQGKNSKDNISSLMIAIKDKPGALYGILESFAKAKINLTNLVSRPSKKKMFDYLFYVDFVGSIDEERVQRVLKKINPYTINVKILGSYPKGIFR